MSIEATQSSGSLGSEVSPSKVATFNTDNNLLTVPHGKTGETVQITVENPESSPRSPKTAVKLVSPQAPTVEMIISYNGSGVTIRPAREHSVSGTSVMLRDYETYVVVFQKDATTIAITPDPTVRSNYRATNGSGDILPFTLNGSRQSATDTEWQEISKTIAIIKELSLAAITEEGDFENFVREKIQGILDEQVGSDSRDVYSKFTAERRDSIDNAVLAEQLKRAMLYAELAILTAPKFAAKAGEVSDSVKQRLYYIYGQKELEALLEARKKALNHLKPPLEVSTSSSNQTGLLFDKLVNKGIMEDYQGIVEEDEETYERSDGGKRVDVLMAAKYNVDELFSSIQRNGKGGDVTRNALLYVLSTVPSEKERLAALAILEGRSLFSLDINNTYYPKPTIVEKAFESRQRISIENFAMALDLEKAVVVEPTIGMKRLRLMLHTFVGGFLSSHARATR